MIELGGGPTELGLVATASSLGLLVSVLLGGVAADRLPRRALLVVVELVRMGTAWGGLGVELDRALLIVVEAVRVGTAWRSGCSRSPGCCSCGSWWWSGSWSARRRRSSSRPTPRCCPPCCRPTSCSRPTGGGHAAPGRAAGGRPGAGRAGGRRVTPRAWRCWWPAGSTRSRCWRCWRCAPLPDAGRGRGQLGARRARRGLPLPVPHRLAVRHARVRQPVRAGADRPDRGAAAVRGARPDRRRRRRLRLRARRVRGRRRDRLARGRRRCGCRGAT